MCLKGANTAQTDYIRLNPHNYITLPVLKSCRNMICASTGAYIPIKGM